MTFARSLTAIAAAMIIAAGAACGDSKTMSTNEDKTTLPASSDSQGETVDGPPFPVDRPGRVGMLVHNEGRSPTHPGEYCLDDGRLYRGAPARIAGVNVFGPVPGELDGADVVAYGDMKPSLLEALEEIGPCPDDPGPPEAQMRSDWVPAEGGSNTTRARLAEIPYLHASSLHALTLHEVAGDATDGAVAIVLHNPFDTALDGLEARAHYEGGPGKPMPMFRPLALSLPPGETQRLEVPATIEGGPAGALEGEPRGIYRLHSIDLSGRVGELVFDVALIANLPRRDSKR